NVSAMMPIVFCASLVPCMNPIAPALNFWAQPKNQFTRVGRAFWNTRYRTAITMNPSTKPAIGDVTMGTITFHNSPLPSHQCSLLGCDQMITCQLPPDAASAEPHNPPISAWLELEGSPNHQVIKFQMIAPNNAQMMMSEPIATSFESTRPDEIVFA